MVAVNILPDSCAWIDFFRGSPTTLSAALEQALLNGSVVTCGVVLYELTQGIKSPMEEKALTNAFKAVPFLELSHTLWIEAGRLSSSLRTQGYTLPMSDVLIAVLAMQHDATVLTADEHFSAIPGLKVTDR